MFPYLSCLLRLCRFLKNTWLVALIVLVTIWLFLSYSKYPYDLLIVNAPAWRLMPARIISDRNLWSIPSFLLTRISIDFKFEIGVFTLIQYPGQCTSLEITSFSLSSSHWPRPRHRERFISRTRFSNLVSDIMMAELWSVKFWGRQALRFEYFWTAKFQRSSQA